ncbi:MAG: hypothetical protein ACJ79W_15795 [Myxococcales bacterium]
MRNAIRSFLLIGILASAAPAFAQQRPPVADQIAKTYGFDSFGQIDAIRYTFNIDFGAFKLSRSWIWEPKTDRITYDGKDKSGKPVKISYSRSQLATQDAFVKEQVDPGFFNDQYWLLFPFHVLWDTSATVQDAGKQKLPLGKGSAQKVAVKYPSSGGYLPGDTWELFVGKDGRIQALHFIRGGDTKPTALSTNWADHKKAGPLLVALDHRGTCDGQPCRIFFSDVAVKLAGSSNWLNAQ